MLIGDVWISQHTARELAALLGIHRTTVTRWMVRGALPPAVYQLLLITQRGQLGALHDAWRGWSIDTRRGELVTPTGDTLRPGQILAMPYSLHLLSALRLSLAQRRLEDADQERTAECARG